MKAINLFVFLITIISVIVFTQIIIKQTPKSNYRILFDTIDSNQDGFISINDWHIYLKNLEPDHNVQENDVKPTFNLIDKNKNEQISWEEFQLIIEQEDQHLLESGLLPGPREIHIGLTSKQTEMQVMWVTTHQKLSNPIVFYGISKHKLDQSVLGTWHTYNVGHLGFHGRIYIAVMTGLQPQTQYFYKVGDQKNKEFSEVYDFYSAPIQLQSIELLNICIIADEGTIVPFSYPVSKQIERHNNKHRFNFALLAGDIAYAGTGSQQFGEIEPIWDLYGEQIQPWAAKTPFMPGVGNHEKYYNYSAYTNRYVLPASSGSYNNFYFSFNYADVHVVHMDTEIDYSVGSPQWNFLNQDLQQASSNSNIKWIIFGGHRPFYSSNSEELDQHIPGSQLLSQLEDLLVKYKVDLVINGHMHNYERTYPVYNGTVYMTKNSTNNYFIQPQKPIYITQGTAGALIKNTFVKPQPQWSATRHIIYGYGKMQIFNNGTMKYIYYEAVTGSIIDEWYIVK